MLVLTPRRLWPVIGREAKFFHPSSCDVTASVECGTAVLLRQIPTLFLEYRPPGPSETFLKNIFLANEAWKLAYLTNDIF